MKERTMTYSNITIPATLQAPAKIGADTPHRRRKLTRGTSLHRMTWICLLLACVSASWFSYQYFLVPQPVRFAPDWQASQWIQPTDGTAPVAYFRHVTTLNSVPDSAFITIAASQVFSLYVNQIFVGSNQLDFGQGNFPRAYMYDITSLVTPGQNVIAARVANIDEQSPALRLDFGLVWGKSIIHSGSDNQWQATMQSTLVYPRYQPKPSLWTNKSFDASSWPPSHSASTISLSPQLTVNPLIYEKPTLPYWISAGVNHEAYFVRHITLPLGLNQVWLRLSATGTAAIFANGHLLLVWSGQAPAIQQNLTDYLSYNPSAIQYRSGFSIGVYDISSYLHAGVNTIAVHVLAPGNDGAQVGLDNLNAAMSADILVQDFWNNPTWFTSTADWHASSQAAPQWANGSTATLAWPAPVSVGRPGASRTFYLTDNPTAFTVQVIPIQLVIEVIFFSLGAVLALWCLISFLFMRRFHCSFQHALETMSLAYLPACAAVAVLAALSREPQIPQPFPYTWSWGLLLLALVTATYALLWQNAQPSSHQQPGKFAGFAKEITNALAAVIPFRTGLLKSYRAKQQHTSTHQNTSVDQQQLHPKLQERVLHVFSQHWPIIVLVLIAIPLITYNLNYEPYWQDELSSFYASQGILAHGLPFFPSGFLYEKAEAYSYLLALWRLVFGDSSIRLISALEYIISIPLLYAVGSYLFERRIALLAAAMLTFSPISLVWGRQVRMYEQAQLLTLVVLYLFFKAVHERQRVRFIYLAVGCLVLDYLSHEEVFIILPAIVICVLFISKEARRPLPSVFYNKHWWIAAFLGASVIGVQLLLTKVTHAPVLGTDSSQRPPIQLTANNIPFYFYLLFFPSVLAHGTYPWITLNSVLATIGCILVRRNSTIRAKYCALFLVISFLTLVCVFTMQADRYFYPLMPVYYLMGAYALLVGFRAVWAFALTHLVRRQQSRAALAVPGGYLSLKMRASAIIVASLVCASILIVPILPLSNYNLFISRLVGFSYHRHYPDYDAAGQYLQQHWQKGDIVICVAPDFSVYYYTNHADYFFSVDRALFLLENNGHIISTSIGDIALLNQSDLQAALATHARVWIISDNGRYQVQNKKRFTFPPDFHLVFEGYGSAIYSR